MKKGEVLRDQKFERYFMATLETVDVEIIDFIGVFYLLIKIKTRTGGTEKHIVSLSNSGILRSREKLA